MGDAPTGALGYARAEGRPRQYPTIAVSNLGSNPTVVRQSDRSFGDDDKVTRLRRGRTRTTMIPKRVGHDRAGTRACG